MIRADNAGESIIGENSYTVSVESSVHGEEVSIEETVSQLDGNGVLYELETAIAARDDILTPDEVRMKTRR